MKNEKALTEIVKSLVKDSSNKRQNKIQIFKNIGQMDPSYFSPQDTVGLESSYFGNVDNLDDLEQALSDEFTQKMRGYSANIWTQKTSDNRIYWNGNDNVIQNDTHYLGKTIFDSLALETEKGIIIYSSTGRPLRSSDKISVVSDKEFGEVLGDLKGATQDKVKKVIDMHKEEINKRVFRDVAKPAYVNESIIEQNRNYNILI